MIEDADRDNMKRARFRNLTRVQKRRRLVARRNARMTGSVFFCKDLCGFHVVPDANIVRSVVKCSRLCVSSEVG